MTFEELEKAVPNGFHDSELTAIEVDYARGLVVLSVSLDVGGVEEHSDLADETLRPARVIFTGVKFVVIDPPETPTTDLTISVIDAGNGQPRPAPLKRLRTHENTFLCWLFLSRTNSFIRIAAEQVELRWVSKQNAVGTTCVTLHWVRRGDLQRR